MFSKGGCGLLAGYVTSLFRSSNDCSRQVEQNPSSSPEPQTPLGSVFLFLGPLPSLAIQLCGPPHSLTSQACLPQGLCTRCSLPEFFSTRETTSLDLLPLFQPLLKSHFLKRSSLTTLLCFLQSAAASCHITYLWIYCSLPSRILTLCQQECSLVLCCVLSPCVSHFLVASTQ